MRNRKSWSLAFLVLFACKDKEKDSDDCTPENCPAPLICFGSVCTAPGDGGDTGDDGDAGDDGGDTGDAGDDGGDGGSGDSGSGDDGGDDGGKTGTCTLGELYCGCYQGECGYNQLCDEDDKCVMDPCPKGTLGCKCSEGGTTGCYPSLDCLNGYCVDDSGQCVQPYNDCFDFLSQMLFDPGCCDGTVCLRYEPDESSICSTTCVTHEECVTGCCATAISGIDYCFTSEFCDANGKCIDSCFYADDGDCDDGGPDSDFSLCSLGTDCTDCGPRF